jgi:hypothetical protein
VGTQGQSWAKMFGTLYIISGSIFDADGDTQPDARELASRMRSTAGQSELPFRRSHIAMRSCELAECLERPASGNPAERQHYPGLQFLYHFHDYRAAAGRVRGNLQLAAHRRREHEDDRLGR